MDKTDAGIESGVERRVEICVVLHNCVKKKITPITAVQEPSLCFTLLTDPRPIDGSWKCALQA